MNDLSYIAFEGVIGVGKTTLAKMVADKLKAELILEQFEANPFLEKFYNDPKRFAFQTQMFFLINRFQQLQNLIQENLFNKYLVADYIFEKDQIFAYLNLNKDELKLYESIFPLIKKEIRKPDLVVYLQVSTERLFYNIRQRARKIEREITRNYIRDLNETYNEYFFRYTETPLLIVNASEIDFVKNKNDFDELFKQIMRTNRAKVEYFNPERKGR